MTPLLEWLDNLGVPEPHVAEGPSILYAGALSLDDGGDMGYEAEVELEILRHANCYELTANGQTLTVDRNPDGDREAGAVELVHDAG